MRKSFMNQVIGLFIGIMAASFVVGVGNSYADSSPRQSQVDSKARFQVHAIPVERWHELMKQQPIGWVVTYEEWQQRWKSLLRFVNLRERSVLKMTTQWSRVDVTGRIQGQLVNMKLVFHLKLLRKGWHRLSIPLKDIQVAGARFHGIQGTLVPHPAGLFAWVKGPVNGSISIQAGASIRNVPRGKVVRFKLPKAAISSLNLRLPVGQEVQLYSKGLRVHQTSMSTSVVGGLLDSSVVHFRFRRQEQRSSLKPTLFANVDTRYRLRPNTQWLVVHSSVSLRMGRLRSFKMEVPKGYRLFDIKATKLISVSFNPRTSLALIQVSHWPSSRKLSFKLHFVRQSPVETSQTLRPVRVVEAYAQEGQVSVNIDQRLRHRLHGLTHARQMKTSNTASSRDANLKFMVWKQDSSIRLSLRTLQPQLKYSESSKLEVQARQAKMTWHVKLSMTEGSLYQLSGKLASPWKLFSVKNSSGKEVEYSINKTNWSLKLSKRLYSGESRTISFVAIRNFKLPSSSKASLSIPTFSVNKATFQQGTFAIHWPRFYKGKLLKAKGLQPMWSAPRLVNTKTSSMKWRLLSTNKKGSYSLNRKPSQATFQAVGSYQLQNGWVQANWKLQGNIRGAGVRLIKIQPTAWKDSYGAPQFAVKRNRILSVKVSKKKGEVSSWTLRLAGEHFGKIIINLSAQWRSNTKTALQFPLLANSGQRLRRGFVRIYTTNNLEVKPKVTGFEAIDPLEIPAFGKSKYGAPLLAYRYLPKSKPGLSLELTSHQGRSLQDVVVNNTVFSASLHGPKHWKMRVQYRLWTRGGGAFRFQLPSKAELWSVVVNRKGVKPLLRGTSVDVQLSAKSKLRQQRVEVVYLMPSSGLPESRGHLSLVKPKHRYPVLRTEWNLYLPKSYRMLSLGGTLKPMNTVQPRSLLAQMYSFFQRELGDIGIIICLAFFAILWWIKGWVWNLFVTIVTGLYRLVFNWRVGLAWTFGVFFLLGLGIVTLNLLTTSGKDAYYYSPKKTSKPASRTAQEAAPPPPPVQAQRYRRQIEKKKEYKSRANDFRQSQRRRFRVSKPRPVMLRKRAPRKDAPAFEPPPSPKPSYYGKRGKKRRKRRRSLESELDKIIQDRFAKRILKKPEVSDETSKVLKLPRGPGSLSGKSGEQLKLNLNMGRVGTTQDTKASVGKEGGDSLTAGQTKPKGVVTKASSQLADGKLMQGLRSLNIASQVQGWRVGSYGLGTVSNWNVMVYKESWLRWWLMIWTLFAFLLFWRLGVHFPRRKFLLFWGGLFLAGASAMLLKGLSVTVANSIQLGILAAGVTYLWPKHWLSSIRFLNKPTAMLVALLALGSVFSPEQAHAQVANGPVQVSRLNLHQRAQGPLAWRDWLCQQSVRQQSNLANSPELALFAPYKVGKKGFRLSSKSPVLVPGGWWELLRMGGASWCKRLPKAAQTWMQAHIQLTVKPEHSVKGEIRFLIHKQQSSPESIALGLTRLPISEATYNQLPISLSYRSGSYQFLARVKGQHIVVVRFEHTLKQGQTTFSLALPKMVGSSTSVSVLGSRWQALLSGVKGQFQQNQPKISTVSAVLGQSRTLKILWRKRKQQKDQEEETASLRSQQILTFQTNLIRLRSLYQFSRKFRRLERLMFVLPKGSILEKVEGRLIRSWRVQTSKQGNRVLAVVLERKVLDAKVQVDIIKLRSKQTGLLKVPFLRPNGVGRLSGWLGIQSQQGVSWSLRDHRHLDQSKLQEWSDDGKSIPGAVASVFRYRRPPFLKVSLAPQKDERRVHLVHHMFVSKKAWLFQSKVSIIGRGLPKFKAAFLVSPDLNIKSITSTLGTPVEQYWLGKRVGALQLLYVAFSKPIHLNQQIVLKASLRGVAKGKLPILVPMQGRKWTGKLVIRSLGDVSLGTDSLLNLSTVSVRSCGHQSVVGFRSRRWFARLAFEFKQPYQGVLNLQSIKAQRRSRLVLHAHLGASRHHVRAWFQFKASGGGARSYFFSVPAVVAKSMVWGNKAGWVHEMAAPKNGRVMVTLRGINLKTELNVAFRYQWNERLENAAKLPLIRPERVVQSDTLVSVSAPPSIRILRSKAQTSGLQGMEPEKFPMETLDNWINLPGSFNDLEEVPVLATYRTRKSKWSLALPREQLKTDITFRAQADTATLYSIVSRQGEIWTQANYSIRTAGLQFLKVSLPQGAKLWQTRVSGHVVKPSLVGNVIQIPLPPRQSSDLAYPVQVLFASAASLPKWYGNVTPTAPKLLNLEVVQTFWIVNLPTPLSISAYDGNMEETTTMQIQYQKLQNALGLYRKLESLSQVGKQSSRVRALDNLRRQWTRVKGLMQNQTRDISIPLASPGNSNLINKSTKQKSLEFQNKLNRLQGTFRSLQQRHQMLERRYQKNRSLNEFYRRKRLFHNKNIPTQQPRPAVSPKRRYKPRYRRRYRYYRKGKKGSFMIPLWRRWRPGNVVPQQHRPSSQNTFGKPCRQVRVNPQAANLLKLPLGGYQYTFVAVGGQPQLTIQVYRKDRLYRIIGWALWGLAALVLLIFWRKKWFSWKPV